jgi:spore germination protein KA
MKLNNRLKSEQYVSELQPELENPDQLKQLSAQSSDFKTTTVSLGKQEVVISYYKTLVDEKLLQQVILAMQTRALDSEFKRIEDIKVWIPIDDIEITDQIKSIQFRLLKGYAIVILFYISYCKLV